MVISIPNDTELYAQQLALDCANKSIVFLLKMMQRFYTTSPFAEASLEVQINASLLTDGYRVNPSMLARNAHTGIYSYVRGMYREGVVVALFTNNSDDGVGFMRRLKDFLEASDGSDKLDVPFEEVPETYRYRPEQLRYRIKQALGLRLLTRKTKSNWIYRRGNQTA